MRRQFWTFALPALMLIGPATDALVLAQVGPVELKSSRREADVKRWLEQPPLPELVAKGRILWVQRCALCHESNNASIRAMAPWLDREVIKARGESTVRAKIATGGPRMPGFQYALQPKHVDEILAFLNTVTPDQKPKLDMKPQGTAPVGEF